MSSGIRGIERVRREALCHSFFSSSSGSSGGSAHVESVLDDLKKVFL